jgi:hypothetical protein
MHSLTFFIQFKLLNACIILIFFFLFLFCQIWGAMHYFHLQGPSKLLFRLTPRPEDRCSTVLRYVRKLLTDYWKTQNVVLFMSIVTRTSNWSPITFFGTKTNTKGMPTTLIATFRLNHTTKWNEIWETLRNYNCLISSIYYNILL